jgi:parallel beta-helix repeat protein
MDMYACGNGANGLQISGENPPLPSAKTTLALRDSQSSNNGQNGCYIIDMKNVLVSSVQSSANGANGGLWKTTNFLTLHDSSFSSNTLAGAKCMTLKGSKILQNLFSNNGGDGLHVQDGSSNTIMIGEVYRNGGAGIRLDGGSNNVVAENRVQGNANGIVIDGDNNAVYKNVLSGPSVLLIDGSGNEVAPQSNGFSAAPNAWNNIIIGAPPM